MSADLTLMADLYRRLHSLLLVALLLLIVVVFHICFLGHVPGRKQTRRTPKRSTKMDKLQTKTTMSVGGGGSSRQRCNSAEGGRRSYDPTLYSHLPSHEIPLPPSDDDVDDPRSSTVPLGSASVAASRTKTAGLAGCRTPPPGGAIDGEGDDDERNVAEVVGRQFWDEERQRLRSTNTAGITRGVARIGVGAEDEFEDCGGGGGEEIAADDDGDDNDEDDEMEIHPVGRKRGGSTARTKVRESRKGGKGKKCGEESSAGDGTKNRDFWTVEHMIALIRAKRDQDSHLAGLGHNYGRMKTKTWKCEDVEKRLVQMGVTSRKVVDYGKKWDNLYQQFKSVHKFMGESRKPNYFTLTSGERRERGFDFRMDECVYSEMKAMSGGDHTIHPTNLVDTGAPGGVQLLGAVGGRNESGGSDVGGVVRTTIVDRRGIRRSPVVAVGRAVVDGLACPWCAARLRTVQKGIPGGIPYRWHSIATAPKAPSVHGLVAAGLVIRFDATIGGFGLRGHPRPPTSTSSYIHVRQAACHRTGPSSTAAAKRCNINVVRRQGARHRPPTAPSFASSTWSFVHVSQAPQLFTFGTHFFVDDMPPRGASGKAKRNSGSGDVGETQKGRGRVPKSKRPRYNDDNSEHSGDLHGEEESMVDAQGADVMKRMGFRRDGVSREQLAALKQGFIGGVAVSLARTPKAAGIVMTDARVARQVPPKVGQVAPCPPIPTLQAGTSGVDKTPSAQKVDTTAGGAILRGQVERYLKNT
ncbi:hypothetical protein CBR_g23147 [Chara braunii]|uniref:Myb/SANT-like domain-containing protein n=1 Tax=Chara braunii TaxID=69332 RepID=A0A388L404_CHABU|nr:hypothetical protein CBR_g23147 [Chara braunii]|eukprot:GBG76933.1 hypothetical protein CBR_g23147 [Chara braunii]